MHHEPPLLTRGRQLARHGTAQREDRRAREMVHFEASGIPGSKAVQTATQVLDEVLQVSLRLVGTS